MATQSNEGGVRADDVQGRGKPHMDGMPVDNGKANPAPAQINPH